MEYPAIDRFMRETGLARDPAFDVLHFLSEPIREKRILGLYYPEGSPEGDGAGYLPPSTIILPPDSTEGTLLHELGHRHGDFYFGDMSEKYAENYRQQQEQRLSSVYPGSYARTAVNISQEKSFMRLPAASVSDWSMDGIEFANPPATLKAGVALSVNIRGFVNELRDAFPDFWQVAVLAYYTNPDYTVAASDYNIFQSGFWGTPVPYSKRISIYNAADAYKLGTMPNRNIYVYAFVYANHDHTKSFIPFDEDNMRNNGWEVVTAFLTEVLVDAAPPPPPGPGWHLYKQASTNMAQTYRGKAETATFTFATGPEQLDFINNFFVNQLVNDCEKSINDAAPGDHLLTLELYRDTSKIMRTDYRLVLTSTDITGNALPWAIIIVGALVVISLFLIAYPVLTGVTNLIWGPPGEEGKRPSALSNPIVILGIGAAVLAGIAIFKDTSVKGAFVGRR